jgi:hypothetical protein
MSRTSISVSALLEDALHLGTWMLARLSLVSAVLRRQVLTCVFDCCDRATL